MKNAIGMLLGMSVLLGIGCDDKRDQISPGTALGGGATPAVAPAPAGEQITPIPAATDETTNAAAIPAAEKKVEESLRFNEHTILKMEPRSDNKICVGYGNEYVSLIELSKPISIYGFSFERGDKLAFAEPKDCNDTVRVTFALLASSTRFLEVKVALRSGDLTLKCTGVDFNSLGEVDQCLLLEKVIIEGEVFTENSVVRITPSWLDY